MQFNVDGNEVRDLINSEEFLDFLVEHSSDISTPLFIIKIVNEMLDQIQEEMGK